MKIPFAPVVLAFTLFSHAASATLVTTSMDEDNGSLGGGSGISLREAVKYSAAGSTITFAPALSGQTIRLALGYLPVSQSLTVDASALPAGLTLSADRTGNGKTSDDTYAILLTGGNLLLNSLTLTGANCGESSGCVTVQPSGTFTLTLDRCTLTRNAGYHASALYCHSYQPRPTDAITIRNSTISRNSVVKGSSVLEVFYSNLTIQNSTFSQNAAGAVYYRAGDPPATLSLLNSTISGNTATYGAGGLYLDLEYLSPPATIHIDNTICTGNTPANLSISPDLTLSGSNNITSGDPALSPLGDYGGPTQTMPPTPKSPAIDLGAATILTTDQRGLHRVGPPDIGAAEYQGSAETALLWNFDLDGDGSPYGLELALGTNPAVADSSNTRNLKAPTFNTAGHAVLRFGIGSSVPGTRWILKRSADLGTFQEIYRYDGTTDTAAAGVTYVRTSTGVTITDENPLPGGAFYRFEARLEP